MIHSENSANSPEYASDWISNIQDGIDGAIFSTYEVQLQFLEDEFERLGNISPEHRTIAESQRYFAVSALLLDL